MLFSVHLFPPTHNCGGEYFLLNMARYMISQGHEVKVLLHQAHRHDILEKYNFEGVVVYPPSEENTTWLVEWSNVIFSHLEYAPWTIEISKIFKRPFFFISHNSHPYTCIIHNAGKLNVIYNSNWMKERMKYDQRSIVLHPPLSQDKVISDNNPVNNEYITIINCNERKGGTIVSKIARAMPKKKFLFVLGSYDEQIVPGIPNVMCWRNSPDMKPVYAATRILLMPSAYESWGMTCTEAMANGIPVICTPTDGLLENAGDAGLFIDTPNTRAWMNDYEQPAMDYLTTSDIDCWVKQIQALDDNNFYFHVSNKCKARAAALDPNKELEEVEKFIQDAYIRY